MLAQTRVILLAGLGVLAGQLSQAAPTTPSNPNPGSTSSPGPTTAVSSVVLSWSASSGTTLYGLGVRDMVSNTLVVDTTLSGTSFTANLSPGKQYRWNVNACNGTGCSSYTTPLYFQTPTSPPAITGVSPSSPTGSDNAQPFTINGSNFVAGANVTLRNVTTGLSYPNRAASSFSGTQIVINPVFGTPAHTWSVQVINPNGQASNTLSFQLRTVAPNAGGQITIAPSPCTIASPGGTCAVNVSWTTTSVQAAQIWMEDTQRPEQRLFDGPTGSQTVPGLLALPQRYEFRLYDYSGGSRGRMLHSVRVEVPASRESTTDTADLARELPLDGTEVNGGTNLVKSWTLLNSGTSTWGAGYTLRYVSGQAGSSRNPIALPTSVPPGSSYTFRLPLVTSAQTGEYREDWQFLSAKGSVIPVGRSQTVWISYRVAGAETAELGAELFDETIPKGTVFRPGERFRKVWRVRNNGRSSWSQTTLRWAAAPPSVNLIATGTMTLAVPPTAPGQLAELQLEMQAPQQAGTKQSLWQLQSATGQAFGPVLSAVIEVRQESRTATLITSENYDSGSRQLQLEATVRDDAGRVLNQGRLEWRLLNSARELKANGVLLNDSARWVATYRPSSPLEAGVYIVDYQYFGESGQTGTAQGRFLVNQRFLVSGKVTDGATKKAIGGVLVSASGQTSRSDENGEYSLGGLETAETPVLTAARAGYQSYSEQLAGPGTATRLVKDIVLQPAGGGTKPVITKIDTEPGSLYIMGISTLRRYTVIVNWNGSPGHVDFMLNDATPKRVSADENEVKTELALDWAVRVSQTVKIIAVNRAGVASDPVTRTYQATRLPKFLRGFTGEFQTETNGYDTYFIHDLALAVPPWLSKTLDVPMIGKLGAELGIDAHFDYRLSDSSFFASVGAGLDWESGIKKRIPFGRRYPQQGRMKIFFGDKSLNVNFKASTSGTAPPITFNEASGELSAGGEFSLPKVGLLDLKAPGLTNQLNRIPALRPFVNQISLQPRVNILATGSGDVSFDPEFRFKQIRLDAGAGLSVYYSPLIFDFWIKGTTTLGFQYPGEFFRELRFEGEAGWKANAWILKLEPETLNIGWTYTPGGGIRWNSVPPSPMAWSWKADDRGQRILGAPQFVAYSPKSTARSANTFNGFRALGQRVRGARTNTAQSAMTLVENLYSQGGSAMAGRGNELMLVYGSDSGSPSTLQFTDLYYTRFDGENWSAPEPISNDPRGEAAPQVAYDGNGDAIVMFQRFRDAAFETVDLKQIAAQMEIAWTRWDHTTGRWTTAQSLTNNAVFDGDVKLAGPLADGTVVATWTTTPSNDWFGMDDQGQPVEQIVMTAAWNPGQARWTQPVPLVSMRGRLSQQFVARGNRVVYAWTEDRDGNFDTSSDREVMLMGWNGQSWSAARQVTEHTKTDEEVRIALGENGELFVFWLKDGDLVFSREGQGEPSIVRRDSGTLGFRDSALTAGPGNLLALIWQEQTAKGPNALARVFDPASSTWSQDLALFEDDTLKRRFSPVWDESGNLTMAYQQVELLPNGGFGRVDLGVLKRALVKDLTILPGDFLASADRFLPGAPLTLKATIRNRGGLAVENAVVGFGVLSPQGDYVELGRQAISGWLEGGGTATVQLQTYVPVVVGGRLLAIADPDKLQGELDESNNSQQLSLGSPQLALSLRSAQVAADGSARIVVEVRNDGMPESATASVQIRAANGTVSASTTVDPVAPGSSAQLALSMGVGNVPATGSYFDLLLDEPSTTQGGLRESNRLKLWLAPDTGLQNKVGSPVLSPDGGAFDGEVFIRVSCPTEGAVIHYTTTGDEPDESAPVIAPGAVLRLGATGKLRTKAWKTGWIPSEEKSAGFEILSK